MTTIVTTQAPDAKPVGISISLTTDWITLIEVPNYEIPEEVFGGSTVIVPAVAEIISPLMICNKTLNTEDISIRIFRAEANTHFFLANELPIPGNDILPIPLNGQFIYTGDTLEIKCSSNNTIDVTLSYTVGQAEQDDIE
jgi:hypothetical protein